MTPNPAPPIPFLKRIKIRNFKSIAYCDVELGPLTILVGRNGSGKSNFLDAIRFVGDAISHGVYWACKERGSVQELIHKATPRADRFAIEIEIEVSPSIHALFAFEIQDPLGPLFKDKPIASEKLEITLCDDGTQFGYVTENGTPVAPPGPARLPNFPKYFHLMTADDREEFNLVRDALLEMKFYNFNDLDISEVKNPQSRTSERELDSDGSNLSDVAARLQSAWPAIWSRLIEYLTRITPTIKSVEARTFADYVYLEFEESNAAGERPSSSNKVFHRKLTAAGMSDGTLRALATLVAINPLASGENRVRLVGVEEPESGLHPAAAGVLMSALREAAESRQIVVTTQSDDLLDRYDPETDCLLVAEMRNGATEIARLDRASRNIIKKQLYSAGEMLRMDQLRPDWEDLQQQNPEAANESAGAVQ